jgi:hypothetical protein
MSATSSNSQPGQPQQTINAERPLVRRLRLTLLWAVVALACFLAYRLGDTYAEWREVANQRPTRQSMTPTDAAFATAMTPLAGSWSFDDLDWNISSAKVSSVEVGARFEAFSNSAGPANPETLPDVSDQFITLAANMQILPVEHAGNKVYKLDRPELKGQLVTRDVAGRSKVISITAAAPSENDEWLFYELSPREATTKPTKPVEHLLPVPANAKREGGKFGADGDVLLELISLDTNANDLLSSWRTAGCDIHETGLGDGTAFSYLVTRGNDTIYVWSADAKDSLHNLMLVRNPGSGDTVAKP